LTRAEVIKTRTEHFLFCPPHIHPPTMSLSSLLLVAALVFPTLVVGWGAIGHAAIANTAWELMDATAKRIARTYLPSGATMESIASLADSYAESSEGNWSAHLHYVNMNKGQVAFEMSVDCSDGCVVSAIINNTAALSSQEFLDAMVAEPNPFEFLVHFVGDVHQPLHVGWGYDRGGNSVPVYFFDKKTELHAVWDTAIIERYNSDWSYWSKQLLGTIQANSSLIPTYTQNMDPSSWADESFAYVRNVVYNFNSSAKVGDDPNLGDAYYNQNLPIITERLIAASIRLSALLNKIFG